MVSYPAWLRRVAIVARETCLPEGDIIRLTKGMIDRQRREIVPAGGRVKTGVEQRAPLTDRVLEILDEIERENVVLLSSPTSTGLCLPKTMGAR